MNSSPPRTNIAPSQMTSILASARLYSPIPLQARKRDQKAHHWFVPATLTIALSETQHKFQLNYRGLLGQYEGRRDWMGDILSCAGCHSILRATVMPGLAALGIHVFVTSPLPRKSWMAGHQGVHARL